MDLLRFVIVGLILLVGLPAWAGEVVGPAVVVDGDTVEVDGQRFRLAGIDAPEAAQTLPLATGGQDFFGRGAALVLRAMLQDGAIRCRPTGQRDKRGTELAVCFSGDADLGAEMIARGMAWTLPDEPSAYEKLEAEAREARRGFWRDQLERPWLFRRRLQFSAGSISPKGCAFKATVDRKGNKIYFAPWSPWYAKFKVDEKRGDKWVCSEVEAISAGWKAPLFLMNSIVSGVYDP
ncbi:MAG: thermonuclease family protein [Hyphomicrobiaceae bacterium]